MSEPWRGGTVGHSYISSYFHIVFSTKERIPLLREEMQPRFYKFVGSVVKNHEMKMIEIGGMPDHIHLLLSLPATIDVAKAINIVKANSSRWVRESDRRFAWQRGYGAFTVSASNLDTVAAYIRNQKEHHRRRDFKVEFIGLLEKHKIAYDPKYVFG
jgi:putative transposase